MSINRRIVCRGCSGEKGKLKAKCQSCGKCPDETRMVQRQMGPGMIVQQEERVPSKEKCKVEDTVLKTTVERGIADGANVYRDECAVRLQAAWRGARTRRTTDRALRHANPTRLRKYCEQRLSGLTDELLGRIEAERSAVE